MPSDNFYEILGIAPDADPDAIKRAYRQLARRYHPDVSDAADAEEKFKQVQHAYEVLKDPDKRAVYDQFGRDPTAAYDVPPEYDPEFQFHSGGFRSQSDFDDFFNSLFGERFNGAVHDYDKDFHVELGIDLEDAACGAERRLELSLPYESAPRTVAVRIPRGIRAEQRIRLKGLGKPGRNGAAAGDIYARVFFKPHRQFAVEGGNLLLTLPVAPWEAALGETVEVPTLGGTVNLKIPPNSKNGQKLRLKGKGLPASGKEPAGDLFARLEIALPPADTPARKDFYREMSEVMAFNPRAEQPVH